MGIKTTIDQLLKQKQILTEYLKVKLDQEDYHACWDASVDLYALNIRIEYEKQIDNLHKELVRQANN